MPVPYNRSMSPASPPPLSTPLRALPGVGLERAAQLARLRLVTFEDLLLHRPRRYEDRRHLRTIRQLEVGQSTTTRGHIVARAQDLPETGQVGVRVCPGGRHRPAALPLVEPALHGEILRRGRRSNGLR